MSVDQCPLQFYFKYRNECGSCKHYDQLNAQCKNEESIYFESPCSKNDCCSKYSKFEQSSNAFSQCGALVHELLEGYFTGRLLFNELAPLFQDHFYDYVTTRFPFKKMETSYYDTCLEFLNSFSGIDGYNIIGSEIDFYTTIKSGNKSAKFHGVIDLLIQDKESGEFIVCVFKSKKSFKDKNERNKYAKQIYLYSLYVKEKYGVFPSELRFILFRSNTVERIVFDEKELNSAIDWIFTQIDKIKNTTMFRSSINEFFCDNLCDFKDSCPAIIEWRDSDD